MVNSLWTGPIIFNFRAHFNFRGSTSPAKSTKINPPRKFIRVRHTRGSKIIIRIIIILKNVYNIIIIIMYNYVQAI